VNSQNKSSTTPTATDVSQKSSTTPPAANSPKDFPPDQPVFQEALENLRRKTAHFRNLDGGSKPSSPAAKSEPQNASSSARATAKRYLKVLDKHRAQKSKDS